MRAFVAVEPGAEAVAALARIQAEMRAAGGDAAWTREDQWHATVKFLGEFPASRMEAVLRVMHGMAAAARPAQLALARPGTFGRNPPRVIWVGIRDDGGLLSGLAAAAEVSFPALGFPRESRPFRPHLTLGRVRGERGLPALLAAVAAVAVPPAPWTPRFLTLVQSTLTPAGSVYSTLGRCPLGG